MTRLNIDDIRASNPLPDVASAYVELKRDGREFKCLCPFHGDRNPSLTIYQARGDGAWRFQCFACGAHGDVIDWIREIENVDFNEAARRLGARELPAARPAPRALPPDTSEEWLPVLPVPASVGAPFALGDDRWRVWNPKRERESTMRPSASWAYRDADGALIGWVIRCDFEDGGKLTPTITWCRHRETGEHRWCMRPFPTPRPLLGLDDLAKRPDAPVLVVEGEKCRAVAARTLPAFVAVTWPGGMRGVKHADWTPLHGRSVTLWPDADDAGLQACDEIGRALAPHGGTLRIIDTVGQDKGWDIADGVADGMGTAELVAFCKPRVRAWEPIEGAAASDVGGKQEPREVTPATSSDAATEPHCMPADAESATADAEPDPAGPEPEPEGVIENDAGSPGTGTVAPPAAAPEQTAAGDLPEAEVVDLPRQRSGAYDSLVTWSTLDLVLSDKGVPTPNLDNATRLLERHPDMLGRFWFDEFRGQILSTWNTRREPREWTDSDDVRLALWMQRTMGIGRMAVGTARDAVTAMAMAHRRNECREWLEALRWDGTARLHHVLPIGFGVEQNAYSEAVGRCWLIGMVARVLSPGCKLDTMPVFEGEQGRGKSTALQVLVGQHWFAEASESLLSKDFFQSLQGKWLIEIAEMDAFSRAEVTAVKRVITCRTDRFRPPYGRRVEDHPRMCVFAGTTNRDDWHRDETGARRFWPVTVADVDLEWLARWRDALFAEAVTLYRQGASWWNVPAEDAKREQDARRSVDEWEGVVSDFLVGMSEATVGEVLGGALKMRPESWDRPSQMRVATVLRALGWSKVGNARRNGRVVKVWSKVKGGYGGNSEFL